MRASLQECYAKSALQNYHPKCALHGVKPRVSFQECQSKSFLQEFLRGVSYKKFRPTSVIPECLTRVLLQECFTTCYSSATPRSPHQSVSHSVLPNISLEECPAHNVLQWCRSKCVLQACLSKVNYRVGIRVSVLHLVFLLKGWSCTCCTPL